MEIIVDPGRYSYLSSNKFSQYGFSSRSHNNIMVDKMEPLLLSKLRKYPFIYRKENVTTEWQQKENNITMKISNQGYRRIKSDKIDHIRSFIISDNQLVIEDTLNGNKRHIVETFLHIGLGIHVDQYMESKQCDKYNLIRIKISELLRKNISEG